MLSKNLKEVKAFVRQNGKYIVPIENKKNVNEDVRK